MAEFDKGSFYLCPNKNTLRGKKPQIQMVAIWIADYGLIDAFPSIATIAKDCGMSRDSVIKAITELEKMGIIQKRSRYGEDGHQTSNSYTTIVLDDPQSLTTTPPSLTATGGVAENDTNSPRLTNSNTKVLLGADAPVENSTKEDSEEYGNHEINSLIEYMEEKTKLPCKSDKKNRYACYNLLRKYGDDGLRKLINGVAEAHSDRYAPKITNFVQLQAKLSELILWGRQRNMETPTTKPAQTDAKSVIQRLYGERKGQTYEEALAMVQRERENN